MARNNNLHDFLVDVADAIREKKGTSALINPQDFPEEIGGIETIDDIPRSNVQRILSNCTLNNSSASVFTGQSYAAELTPDSGYTLDTADGAVIAITMGSVDVTAEYYSCGKIAIPEVSGDIVITATARAVTNLIDSSKILTGYRRRSSTWGTDAAGSTYFATEFIDVTPQVRDGQQNTFYCNKDIFTCVPNSTSFLFVGKATGANIDSADRVTVYNYSDSNSIVSTGQDAETGNYYMTVAWAAFNYTGNKCVSFTAQKETAITDWSDIVLTLNQPIV